MRLVIACLAVLIPSQTYAEEGACTNELMRDFMRAVNASNQFRQQGFQVVDVSDVSFVRDEDGRLVCHGTLELGDGHIDASIIVKRGATGATIYQIVPD